MSDNEKLFFDYYTKNLFRKVSAQIPVVQEAYRILHGKYWPGCSNCGASAYAQELKSVYTRLLKEKEELTIEIDNQVIELVDNATFMQRVLEQQKIEEEELKEKEKLIEPVKPKNKGGRPRKK